MCRAAPSAHGSPPTKNRRSRKNRRIARKSLHRSAGAPPFNVQHTRTDREEDPATRAVRRPRATPLSLSQPFSPGRRRCPGAGSAPRSATTATGPFLVETCTLHSRMTVGTACSSAKCTSRRQGGRPGAVVATRAAHPGVHGGAVCPNLLQRPRSRRGAGEESLIFRGSYRGRSRSGAPLQQIWTRPRPGPPQESHQHHPGRVRPRTTRTMGSRPCGAPPAPL